MELLLKVRAPAPFPLSPTSYPLPLFSAMHRRVLAVLAAPAASQQESPPLSLLLRTMSGLHSARNKNRQDPLQWFLLGGRREVNTRVLLCGQLALGE